MSWLYIGRGSVIWRVCELKKNPQQQSFVDSSGSGGAHDSVNWYSVQWMIWWQCKHYRVDHWMIGWLLSAVISFGGWSLWNINLYVNTQDHPTSVHLDLSGLLWWIWPLTYLKPLWIVIGLGNFFFLCFQVLYCELIVSAQYLITVDGLFVFLVSSISFSNES